MIAWWWLIPAFGAGAATMAFICLRVCASHERVIDVYRPDRP